jgi:mycothiol synthase
MMEPRPYRDQTDWPRLLTLLQDGRRANNGTYYVHTGDVCWWLFYPDDQEAEFGERIFLWEEGETLLGWCLITPKEPYYDLFIAPHLRGTPEAEAMELWAATKLAEQLGAEGGKKVETFWISEKDDVRIASLQRHGFVGREDFNHYRRSLDEIGTVTVPEGYRIDHVRNEADAERRAVPSQAAFKSKFAWEAYWPRYRSFTKSRVYVPERDMMLLAPDGRCASFCIYWLDEVNKVGLFEPVGTHPDFQRRGLGKALLTEALRRMKAEGMETAIVSTYVDRLAANRIYESVGFKKHDLFLAFGKEV